MVAYFLLDSLKKTKEKKTFTQFIYRKLFVCLGFFNLIMN